MTPKQANKFADEWISAWNSHDLDTVLSHYEEDFEMSSPFIRAVTGEPSGRLKGKENIAAYWHKALDRYPELKFEKLHVLQGASSVTIVYNGVSGLAAEVFLFNENGRVIQAHAHYIS